jgi:glycosyltransferase involved in cell wall biosynthesis
MNKYSIITINYNNKLGLERTIESVINQTFEKYEFIIIDGGSNDGSLDIINNYKDEIDYWISEKDTGVYNAMNKGIMKAHGQYLNFMNSGDCFHSQNTLQEVDCEINGEDIVTGSFLDRETSVIHKICTKDVTLLTLLKETFNHQSTFYNKDLFKQRLYDEKLCIQSDCKFNMQSIIFDNCSVKVIDIIVADYDFNGISGTNKELVENEWQKLLHELYPERILRDYENMYTEEELPIIRFLPQLKKFSRLHHFIYNLIELLLRIRSLFKKP